MDRQITSQVCAEVYRKFPEVSGVQPSIKPHGPDQKLFIFSTSGKTADGKNLNRVVRVVVNEAGKIIKMTTSR